MFRRCSRRVALGIQANRNCRVSDARSETPMPEIDDAALLKSITVALSPCGDLIEGA